MQRILASNRHERKIGKRTRYPSLLTGMISDPDGRPMSPVSTHKGMRRHHYYVTRQKPAEDRTKAWRVSAGEIDRAVIHAFADWLRSTDRAVEPSRLIPDREQADELAVLSVPGQRKLLQEAGLRVRLAETSLQIVTQSEDRPVNVVLPARLLRRGSELKLVLENGSPKRDPDAVLVKLVALAMSARKATLSSQVDPLTSHYSKRHLWQLLRISFLAPDIIAAILEGRQPPTLTGRGFLRATDLPLDWPGQRRLLGFN